MWDLTLPPEASIYVDGLHLSQRGVACVTLPVNQATHNLESVRPVGLQDTHLLFLEDTRDAQWRQWGQHGLHCAFCAVQREHTNMHKPL